MINAAQFRADLPEFSDAGKFTDSQVKYWLNAAKLFLNQAIWGPSAADPWPSSGATPDLLVYDIATELYAAHNIALEAIAAGQANNGLTPGAQPGIVNSKSVDKVSVGIDTNAGQIDGGGNWNLTTYGVRFLQLSNIYGNVPIQVGIGCAGPGISGGPWPGFFN